MELLLIAAAGMLVVNAVIALLRGMDRASSRPTPWISILVTKAISDGRANEIPDPLGQFENSSKDRASGLMADDAGSRSCNVAQHPPPAMAWEELTEREAARNYGEVIRGMGSTPITAQFGIRTGRTWTKHISTPRTLDKTIRE